MNHFTYSFDRTYIYRIIFFLEKCHTLKSVPPLITHISLITITSLQFCNLSNATQTDRQTDRQFTED